MSSEAAGKDWKHEAYIDAVKPWSSQLGAVAGDVVAKCLAPVRLMLWGADQIAFELGPMLKKALQKVPDDKIVEPSPSVVVPALVAMSYTGHERPLNEMFANLIASAMDSRNKSNVHPAFVSVLKEMLPEEAQLIADLRPRFSSKLALTFYTNASGAHGTMQVALIGPRPDNIGIAKNKKLFTNLQRVGLVNLVDIDEPFYEGPIESEDVPIIEKAIRTALQHIGIQDDLGSSLIEASLDMIEKRGRDIHRCPPPSAKVSFSGAVRLTEFGESFRSSCIDGPQ